MGSIHHRVEEQSPAFLNWTARTSENGWNAPGIRGRLCKFVLPTMYLTANYDPLLVGPIPVGFGQRNIFCQVRRHST